MRAIIWVMGIVLALFPAQRVSVVVIPPMPTTSPAELAAEAELIEWDEFWSDSFHEHADAFTALFDSIEYKRSKNGRSMVRRPGDKSYRFVKAA